MDENTLKIDSKTIVVGADREYVSRENPKANRRKALLVTPELIGEMLIRNRAYRIISTIPATTDVIGVYWSSDRRCFTLVLADESFPVVPPGEMIPVIDSTAVRIEAIYEQDSFTKPKGQP